MLCSIFSEFSLLVENLVMEKPFAGEVFTLSMNSSPDLVGCVLVESLDEYFCVTEPVLNLFTGSFSWKNGYKAEKMNM